MSDSGGLSSRTYFRVMHDLHPDESMIRNLAAVEDSMHSKMCETHFSQDSYEFQALDGSMWRQWICWCGDGTYVERVKDGRV